MTSTFRWVSLIKITRKQSQFVLDNNNNNILLLLNEVLIPWLHIYAGSNANRGGPG